MNNCQFSGEQQQQIYDRAINKYNDIVRREAARKNNMKSSALASSLFTPLGGAVRQDLNWQDVLGLLSPQAKDNGHTATKISSICDTVTAPDGTIIFLDGPSWVADVTVRQLRDRTVAQYENDHLRHKIT